LLVFGSPRCQLFTHPLDFLPVTRFCFISDRVQLAEINRHPWVTAGGKGELELELPMMEVVQTHVIPTATAVDPDVLNAICSLGCFKEKEKLIQELLAQYTHNSKQIVLESLNISHLRV